MPATDFARQPAAPSAVADRPASYTSGFDEPQPTISIDMSKTTNGNNAPLHFCPIPVILIWV